MQDESEDRSGLLWAYWFRRDGSAERLTLPVDAAKLGSDEGWFWLHLAQSDVRASNFIASLHLPDAVKATFHQPDERLCLRVDDGVIHGIFADLQREFAGDTKELARWRFACGDRLFVSFRRHPLRSVEVIHRIVEAGQSYDGPATLLEAIVAQFGGAINDILLELSDELDLIEDQILSETSRDERRKLIPVRRMTAQVHRQLLPLGGLFRRLDRLHDRKLPQGFGAVAERLAVQLDMLDDDAGLLLARARLLQDEMDTKINSETNRHLHALSIITAMMLPPTLVTGFFGMNTKDLPLLDTDGGAWIAGGLCICASVLVYWLLRRAGILSP
ncbi:MAG: transporter [Chelatococcus sp.]|uniref:CorA family divalent cation transporter n=1 Tax=Chelatococcus sp. TaxID=1953771 RepID=UPI0025C3CD20|nr:CorA family divalent cation transporter [Chelatococcus sp.]MBX3536771.1 transporter [Chelatococcus sp.]